MNSTYHNCSELILSEITQSLTSISEEQVMTLVSEIEKAEKVFVVGVGRVLLALQTFVKRLNHLGIPAYYVGQLDEPAITEKDLLIVGSGSGESVVPVAITKVAEKYHPRIVHIGSNMHSTVTSMSVAQVRIPCRTKLGLEDELSSSQPMSSLFEQSLMLLLDTVSLMLVRKNDIHLPDLWKQHANLE